MHSGVIELHALADTDRACAQYHDLLPVAQARLGLALVGGVEIGDVGGTKIAGLLFETGNLNAESLLRLGKTKEHPPTSPNVLSDVFFRVGGKETEDVSAYLSAPAGEEGEPAAQGFVIPYADSPLDAYRTGKMVYEDILNTAEDYVYIMTPYLILDGELESALKFAADRGVDVRLLLPGIPDKPMVWYLGKRHYKSLMASGVRIWEYTPGFLHAKSFVSDDCKAVVGSVNLDYRSLYHHFECGSYLAGTPCIGAIKADFLNTLACSREITEEELKHEKLSRRVIGAVMKLIAPLL